MRRLKEPLLLRANVQGMSPEAQASPPFLCHCAAPPLFSQETLRLAENMLDAACGAGRERCNT
eukprot:2785726-Prorocentrum_lima.AAC.1